MRVTEISSSVVDMYMNYTDICQGNEDVCQKIQLVTFALQMASLSADIITTQQIKKYANDAIESAEKHKVILPTEITEELAKISGDIAVKRLFWQEGQNILTTTEISRVGSWMSKAEYEQMVKTSQLQKRSGGLTHILLEGKEHYMDTAGKMYIEFDIPKNTTIIRGSGKGWGIFYEEGSTRWKFYNNKGLNVSQPKVSNIKIIDNNGL